MGREGRRWEEKGGERRKGEGKMEGLCSFKNSLKYVLTKFTVDRFERRSKDSNL